MSIAAPKGTFQKLITAVRGHFIFHLKPIFLHTRFYISAYKARTGQRQSVQVIIIQFHYLVYAFHDGKYITSAGITAGIDLSLSLIEEDQGAEVARSIARDMVMFMHRPGGQSQFAAATHSPSVSNPILQTVLDTIRSQPGKQHTIASLAEDAAVSPRHLGRLFREELGTTPTSWLEQFRLSIAQQLILDGNTVTAAARKSGFPSDDSMRRAFERRLRSTPSEYRARFSSTFRSTA